MIMALTQGAARQVLRRREVKGVDHALHASPEFSGKLENQAEGPVMDSHVHDRSALVAGDDGRAVDGQASEGAGFPFEVMATLADGLLREFKVFIDRAAPCRGR
jgi:hypothetical protein